jgi:hypothetical protein
MILVQGAASRPAGAGFGSEPHAALFVAPPHHFGFHDAGGSRVTRASAGVPTSLFQPISGYRNP